MQKIVHLKSDLEQRNGLTNTLKDSIINNKLTKEFPKMMEVVGSDVSDEEKLKVVYAYIDILQDLEKALDDKTKY